MRPVELLLIAANPLAALAHAVAFFDRRLKDLSAALLDGPSRRSPEVSFRSRRIDFPRRPEVDSPVKASHTSRCDGVRS